MPKNDVAIQMGMGSTSEKSKFRVDSNLDLHWEAEKHSEVGNGKTLCMMPRTFHECIPISYSESILV